MKNPNSKRLFSQQEQESIRQAVAKSEKQTSGEIAVVVVDASDKYPEAEVLGSILLGGLISVIIAILIQHVTIWTFVPLVAIMYFPLRSLCRNFPQLKLPFVSTRRIGEAVHGGAIRSFYENGLHRTRNETGILIYISLLERKVWILGDRGINEKIKPDYWRDHARSLAEGLRTGNACAAVCKVVADCGSELSTHFPYRHDDVNELPDHLII